MESLLFVLPFAVVLLVLLVMNAEELGAGWIVTILAAVGLTLGTAMYYYNAVIAIAGFCVIDFLVVFTLFRDIVTRRDR